MSPLRHSLVLLLAAAFTATTVFAGGFNIRLEGTDGRDGADGTSFSGSRASSGGTGGDGSNGRHGGHAGPSTAGTDASDLDLELREQDGVVEVSGTIRGGGRGGAVGQTLQITGSRIHIDGHGGQGGDGGRGGDGEAGGHGGDGRDATRHSSGGDGGDGGDGGRGGDGTSGSAGGEGADVRIRLSAENMDLLMLVDELDPPSVREIIRGGVGGRAGANGDGGSGGNAGDGGSSHSWTTSHTTTHRDSKGHTHTKTHYKHHYNPGGSDGSRGSSGADGSASLHHGSDGSDGSMTIDVRQADGSVRSYRHRYDVVLSETELVSENRDGIIEPGEMVEAFLTVRNASDMPTPASTPISVYLAQSQYVLSEGIVLTLPALQPGESYRFPNPLRYRVPEVSIPQTGEVTISHDVNSDARMERVQVLFDNFRNPHNFTVRFPIRIREFKTLNNLGRGESSRVLLEVENVSTMDYGTALATAEGRDIIRRALQMGIRHLRGTLGSASIEFFNGEGKPFDLGTDEGFLQKLAGLKRGEKLVLEGSLAISHDAPFYTEATLGARAELGGLGGDGRRAMAAPAVIQQEEFTVRVSQTFSMTPGSKVLLITNHNTAREEYEAWERFFRARGQAFDVWDVSYYGHLSLKEAINGGSTIMDHYAGGTVVLLNNAMNMGEQATAAQALVAKEELVEAMRDHRMNVYVAGGAELETSLNHWLQGGTRHGDDTLEGASERRHGSIGTYLRALAARSRVGEESPLFETIDINAIRWVFRPKAEYIERQAENLRQQLLALYPERRFVVVHQFEGPEIVGHPFGTNRWSTGKIHVVEIMNTSVGRIAGLEVEDAKMHEDGFVLGASNAAAYHQAMGFEQNLDVLKHLLTRGGDGLSLEEYRTALKAVMQGLVVDLTREQSALRQSGWNRGFSDGEIERSLSRLSLLASAPLALPSDMKRAEEAREALVDLMSSVLYVARSQAHFGERVLDFLVWGRRDARVSRVTERLVSRFMETQFGSRGSSAPADAARDTLVSAVRERLREMRAGVPWHSPNRRAAVAMADALKPEGRAGLVTADEIYDGYAGKALGADFLGRAQSYADARSREGVSLVESAAAHTASLLTSGDRSLCARALTPERRGSGPYR